MKADDVRRQVVDSLVAMMAEGNRPWHRGWNAQAMGAPASASTGKAYRGGNAVVLDIMASMAGWESKWWGTFNAWRDKDCVPAKGSRASWVFYFGSGKREVEGEDGEREERRFSIARTFAVFNAAQLNELRDGAKAPYLPAEAHPENYEVAYAAIDAMIERMGVEVRHGGSSAHFSPLTKHVQMPKRGHFDSAEEYYGTLAHEVVHWADHSLSKAPKYAKFATEEYAVGELVAEIGAAYLLREFGVPVHKCEYMEQNRAAYLAGWMKAIKNNPRAIFDAAARAGALVDFLAGKEAAAVAVA